MELNFSTEKIKFENPIKLDSGGFLNQCQIAFQTYGRLNKKKDNAIQICHALTGDQNCTGKNISFWDFLTILWTFLQKSSSFAWVLIAHQTFLCEMDLNWWIMDIKNPI